MCKKCDYAEELFRVELKLPPMVSIKEAIESIERMQLALKAFRMAKQNCDDVQQKADIKGDG